MAQPDSGLTDALAADATPPEGSEEGPKGSETPSSPISGPATGGSQAKPKHEWYQPQADPKATLLAAMPGLRKALHLDGLSDEEDADCELVPELSTVAEDGEPQALLPQGPRSRRRALTDLAGQSAPEDTPDDEGSEPEGVFWTAFNVNSPPKHLHASLSTTSYRTNNSC